MANKFVGNKRFKVLSHLGTGGMGVVYEALDRERDVKVAVKTLRIQGAKQLRRFKNEFRALRDLRHDNLVELGELFEEGGAWFFTMELIEGVDFRNYVRRPRQNGRVFDETCLRNALQGLGAGLGALHRAGKVHRDIQPSNVMVTGDGRVVVLDFGVVLELADRVDTDSITGSPSYMAPEQARGEPVGPAADWYAVGTLLFDALTGRLPFRARDTNELLNKKIYEPAPRPQDIISGLPDDLCSLCRELLATEPEDRPDGSEILERLGIDEARTRPSGGGPLSFGDQRLFVGRSDVIAKLEAAYNDSRDGRTVSVFIEGESGVGKTAVIDHFVAGLADEGRVLVLRGRCHEREFVPYNAFDGIVDAIEIYLRTPAGALELQSLHALAADSIAPLLSIFPVLRGVSELEAVSSGPVLGDGRRLAFLAMREFFARLCTRKAVILIVDDIHWADADSLALLGDLLGPRNRPPLLFLATARKLEDGSSCVATRVVGGDVRQIELEGLRGTEAAELAHRLFERLPGGVVGDIDSVIAETGGHPMFMSELVRHVSQARGTAYASSGDAHLDDALLGRIAALGAEAQRVLEVIAVAGVPLPRDVVAAATEMPAEAFAQQLSVLRSDNLVRVSKHEGQGTTEQATVTTYHHRVREALYAHLSTARRQVLHRSLAAALETQGTESVHLANHFYHAGEHRKAARYALEAARRAVRLLAFDQAAELFQMAISSTPAAERTEDDQCKLYSELGVALQNAGRPREAAAAFTTAAGWAHAPERLELRRRAAEQLLVGGYMEEGIEAIREVLDEAGMKLPPSNKRTLLKVIWNLSRLRRHSLKWQPSEPDDTESDSFVQAATKIDVSWSAGIGLSLVDPLRGMLFGTRSTVMSLRLGEPSRVGRSLCMAAVSAAAIGHKEVARRMAETALQAALEHGSNLATFYAEAARFAYSFYYEQTWRGVVNDGRELERIWHAAGRGRGFELDFLVQFSGWALSMLGDINELSRTIGMYVRDSQRVGNRLLEVSLRVYHSLVHLAADEPDQAHSDITEAIESWLPGRDVFHLVHCWETISQGNIVLYRGDPFDVDELNSRFRRMKRSPLRLTRWVLWQEAYLKGRLALARATAAVHDLNTSSVRRELQKAGGFARQLERLEVPVSKSWGLLLRAGIAHVQGDAEGAVNLLEQSRSGFEDSESRLHLAAVDTRMGQMLGASAGETLIAEARDTLRTLGVARPDKIVSMLAPGWVTQAP